MAELLRSISKTSQNLLKSQHSFADLFSVGHLDSAYTLSNEESVFPWLRKSISQEGYSCGPVTIVFCSDEALLEINQKYLQHDTFTDIVTFDYSSDNEISGDLFISIDRVEENAAQRAISMVDELHRVMIHGILHLCGYSDKSPADQLLMRSKEDYYLSLRTF
jgi:rRNA maturation RNase YbeY